MGSQVLLSIVVDNAGTSNAPYVAIMEVRDQDEITTYLQFQRGTLESHSSTELGVSWNADKIGDYAIRAFLISELANPVVLSPVLESKMTVGLIELPESIIPENPDEAKADEIDDNQDPNNAALSELKEYALEKINKDRADHNVPAVKLSLNEAAQVHAEDVFSTKAISHWMTNGAKPYMTYSRYDGIGDVSQNVAVAGYSDAHSGCSTGRYLCVPINPFKEIEDAEYAMMYDDEECCQNGHRDNILDKYHTHVSLGIFFDGYFFVMVQNFENQYITWQNEINDDNPDATTITMEGYFDRNKDGLSSNDVELSSISIYYDPLPTTKTYEDNYDRNSYENGELVAVVVEPPRQGWYYEQPDDYTLMLADEWKVYPREFEIEFSLADILETEGEGVFTVTLWCEDENKDSFVASAISVYLIN